MGLIGELLQQPWWLVIWLAWLAFVNLASVAFWREIEARWVMGAFVGAFLLMTALYELNGFNRFLGLGHIVFWTPLLFYLYQRLTNVIGPRLFETWLRVLLATNGLSLVIDYVDVLRYLMGDRA
jgi:hypothetical protein